MYNYNIKLFRKERGDFVVLLADLKAKLNAYEEPLKDLRDSL